MPLSNSLSEFDRAILISGAAIRMYNLQSDLLPRIISFDNVKDLLAQGGDSSDSRSSLRYANGLGNFIQLPFDSMQLIFKAVCGINNC
jgi:hypothetical protein